jgi:MoxR-like ATPase
MQERQVTVDGTTYVLAPPFITIATQNPLEQEGTYPLPEAQLDRFMFEVLVDYPSEEEEFEIVRQTTADKKPKVEEVLSHAELTGLQEIVRKVPVADHVIRYAMQFSRLTRQRPTKQGRPDENIPDFVKEYVSWGAGPRASQYLILGAKARSLLHGRAYVSTEDVRAVAPPVLRHRIITNFNAEAEGVTTDEIVRRLAEIIPQDPSARQSKSPLPNIFKTADSL